MSKAAKGLGPSSIPNKQNPFVPGMPGSSKAAKGLGDGSIPMKKDWSAPINQKMGGKKAAPLD